MNKLIPPFHQVTTVFYHLYTKYIWTNNMTPPQSYIIVQGVSKRTSGSPSPIQVNGDIQKKYCCHCGCGFIYPPVPFKTHCIKLIYSRILDP